MELQGEKEHKVEEHRKIQLKARRWKKFIKLELKAFKS